MDALAQNHTLCLAELLEKSINDLFERPVTLSVDLIHVSFATSTW